jgi:hypothetical protein
LGCLDLPGTASHRASPGRRRNQPGHCSEPYILAFHANLGEAYRALGQFSNFFRIAPPGKPLTLTLVPSGTSSLEQKLFLNVTKTTLRGF